mgnify:CR=1 FL=1
MEYMVCTHSLDASIEPTNERGFTSYEEAQSRADAIEANDPRVVADIWAFDVDGNSWQEG